MVLPRRQFQFAMLLIAAAALLWAPQAGAVPALGLSGPCTDNYKASFNDDPSRPEARTWLNWLQLTVGRTTYRPKLGGLRFSDRLDVWSQSGRRAVLTARIIDGPIKSAMFRVGPQPKLWGLLMQVRSQAELQRRAVRIQLVLRSTGGTVIAARNVSYRYDSRLAASPRSSLEFNGPGGRWYLDSLRTKTNLEIGRE